MSERFGERVDLASTAKNGKEALPDLFQAIQEQIGLKLESTREPVEVVVIGKAERPRRTGKQVSSLPSP